MINGPPTSILAPHSLLFALHSPPITPHLDHSSLLTLHSPSTLCYRPSRSLPCLKTFAALFQNPTSDSHGDLSAFIMRFPVPAIVLSLYAGLAASSPIPEPDTSDIDWSKIYIEGITYAGSGCPSASVSSFHNSDWKSFTLAFESSTWAIGPGNPSTPRSRICVVQVRLRYPPGYQYTIYKVDFTGQATLDKGVKLTHQVDYQFVGETPKVTLKAQLFGPFDGSYTLHDIPYDILGNEALVWSPCSDPRALNLNSQLFLDNSMNPQGSGSTAASGDVIVHLTKTLHVYGMRWSKCP